MLFLFSHTHFKEVGISHPTPTVSALELGGCLDNRVPILAPSLCPEWWGPSYLKQCSLHPQEPVLPHPHPGSPKRRSLYSFDLCLGRVRSPFSNFLWASRPLGPSRGSSAPRFPFSFRRLPSCGQPLGPLGLGLCGGCAWASLWLPALRLLWSVARLPSLLPGLGGSEGGRRLPTSRFPPWAGARDRG